MIPGALNAVGGGLAWTAKGMSASGAVASIASLTGAGQPSAAAGWARRRR
jgi:hypothetical protein